MFAIRILRRARNCVPYANGTSPKVAKASSTHSSTRRDLKWAGKRARPARGCSDPSSISDLVAKVGSDAYWRTHGQWFVEEMDLIASCVPMHGAHRKATLAFHSVLNFTQHLMLDSIMLFEDCGAYRFATPGIYGIGKNPEQHIMGFYQGARQLIYGHGSWGLSSPISRGYFSLNNSPSDRGAATARILA